MLGKTGGEISNITLQQGKSVFTHPLAWTDPSTGILWVFIVNGHGFTAYNIITDSNGQSSIVQAYAQNSIMGTSPIMANGVLYIQQANSLIALEPTTGKILWTSSNSGPIHWQSLIVVNGVVYSVDDDSHAYAWGLPTTKPVWF